MDNRENVGADSISAREETQREHMECSPTDPIQREPVGDGSPVSQKPAQPNYYVDLTREEFIRFRMLLAKVNGPLRLRIPSMVISLVCFLVTVALTVEEWAFAGWQDYPDPVLLVAAVLILVPGLYTCLYVPAKMKKTAGQQYDRSVSAGMNYCGRLTVEPEFIEKAGGSATAHIRMDNRALFIESADMMVVSGPGPAVVLPARCLTEEMATALRAAADRLPPQNRRFIARLVPGGQTIAPVEIPKPEEVWVSTFTYTDEEYVTVLRSLLLQRFWKMAPMLMTTATCGAVLFGWNQENLWMPVVYLLIIGAVLALINLGLPLWRIKSQVANLPPHDLTMQVRLDTLALRIKGLTTGEVWVLWCDVDHVYDKGAFVEFVHNKKASLYVPKRAIPDIAAFEAALNRCRDKK